MKASLCFLTEETFIFSTSLISLLQIEREMGELKTSEESVETHESGTESDKDARQAKVCCKLLQH